MIQVHKHNRAYMMQLTAFVTLALFLHIHLSKHSLSTVCAFYETNNSPRHCFSRVMYIEQSLQFREDATQRNRLLGLIRFVKISKS